MIRDLIILLVAGLIVSVIDMNAKLKQVAYILIGVAVILTLLPLVGLR